MPRLLCWRALRGEAAWRHLRAGWGRRQGFQAVGRDQQGHAAAQGPETRPARPPGPRGQGHQARRPGAR
eukprot:11171196-Lingulodinium_polyedra.AAC.1